jgi:hypothetical protein
MALIDRWQSVLSVMTIVVFAMWVIAATPLAHVIFPGRDMASTNGILIALLGIPTAGKVLARKEK